MRGLGHRVLVGTSHVKPKINLSRVAAWPGQEYGIPNLYFVDPPPSETLAFSSRRALQARPGAYGPSLQASGKNRELLGI